MKFHGVPIEKFTYLFSHGNSMGYETETAILQDRPTLYSKHPVMCWFCLFVQILSVSLKPTLSACKARIYDGSGVVAESDCWAEGIDPVPVWLSTASPTRIQVSYRADFTAGLTPRVTYVQNSPVPLGVTLATFSMTLPTRSKST